MRTFWLLLASLACAAPALADTVYQDPFDGSTIGSPGENPAGCQKFADEAKAICSKAGGQSFIGRCFLKQNPFADVCRGTVTSGGAGNYSVGDSHTFIYANFGFDWCSQWNMTYDQVRAKLKALVAAINKCEAAWRNMMTKRDKSSISQALRDSIKTRGAGGASRAIPQEPIKPSIPGNPVKPSVLNNGLLDGDGGSGRNGPSATGTGTSNTGGARTGSSFGVR